MPETPSRFSFQIIDLPNPQEQTLHEFQAQVLEACLLLHRLLLCGVTTRHFGNTTKYTSRQWESLSILLSVLPA